MIGPDSRYVGCIIYIDGADEFLGTRAQIDISPQPDDVFHIVVEGDRIDLLAYRYLGQAELWWIVCDYNEIFLPLELPVGSVLRIPSVDHIEMRILE